MLVGLLYIGLSLLKMFKINDDKGVLDTLTKLGLSLGFLVYYTVYVIIRIVVIGGSNLGFLGWVMSICTLIGIVGAIVFEVLAFALKNDSFKKLKGMFVFLFIAFVLIDFIFPNGMGSASLGDINLFLAITLICYCALIFDDLKLPVNQEKAEESAVEETQEAEENE